MLANGSLYTNVMEQLHFEPDIDEFNITVSVKDNCAIILGGKVKNYTEEYLAEKAVRDLYGVTAVINNIKVKPTISPSE